MSNEPMPIYDEIARFPGALPVGTRLGGDRLEVRRFLGVSVLGFTFVAERRHLLRDAVVEEYFPHAIARRGRDTALVEVDANNKDFFEWGLQMSVRTSQNLALVNHPNIIKIIDYFKQHETFYTVCEFEEGVTLEQFQPADLMEFHRLLDGLFAGLEAVHAAALLHGNITPRNILVRPAGSPVYIDFGAHRRAMLDQFPSPYEAPENRWLGRPYEPTHHRTLSRDVGVPSDIYSLAAVLYQLVTEHPPQACTWQIPADREVPATATAADILRLPKGRPVPAAVAPANGYPRKLLSAIDAALEVKPEQRPQSVSKWRTMLK